MVTAAELLSVAAFDQGRFAQAIPSFGSERMGAPVVAYCRIADRPIRTREPVAMPDAVVVADATLVHVVDLLSGLAPGGCVLVNTSRPFEDLGIARLVRPKDTACPRPRVATVPATELAIRHVGRPVPNAALLGGLCALSGIVGLEALSAALHARFGPLVGAANAAAAAEGFDVVASQDLAGAAGEGAG